MNAVFLPHFKSRQVSVNERMEKGKALRKKYPRKNLGDYKPAQNRVDPVSILEDQSKTRVPDLVPLRYARMLKSPFSFLRGSAAIMAADLAAGIPSSGINVQACGDMHMANFGVFASAEHNLIFGINDFDETLPAPWEWDLKRLVASIASNGRSLGFDKNDCANAIIAATDSYRNRMKEYASMGNVDLWYDIITEKDVLKTLDAAQRKSFVRMTDKVQHRSHLQVLGKLTDIIGNQCLLRENPPFIVRVPDTASGQATKESLVLLLESYFLSLADERKNLLQHYRIIDVARKVVGVGSVGTRCWIIFLTGNGPADPLFLQVKEAQQSVLEPFTAHSRYTHHGQRVVAGQRLIQGAPDIFLGWGEQDGIHYYVRQLRDIKGGIEFDPSTVKIENFSRYCSLCAWALALAHAKSADSAMISGYIGSSEEFDQAMVRFAQAYADQTEKDHRALAAAAKSGRIKVAASA